MFQKLLSLPRQVVVDTVTPENLVISMTLGNHLGSLLEKVDILFRAPCDSAQVEALKIVFCQVVENFLFRPKL